MALGWRGQYFRSKEFFLDIVAVYKRRADVRLFLEIILSLSTVSVFLLFALKPTIVTIIGLLKEIDEKQKTVAILDQKLSDLNTARVIYSQEAESIPLIESAVPIRPDISILVRQIQGIAGKNSVNLTGFSIGEVTVVGKDLKRRPTSDIKPLPGDAKEIPVSISVSGNYQNLNSFVVDLENFRRPFKIDVLVINSSETVEGKIIVATVTGRFPYIGEK